MDAKLEEQLVQLRRWLRGSGGQALWSVLTALRGPDTPSERPDQPPEERARQYDLRRARKRDTVEVIRGHALQGASRGARTRTDTDTVVLPPAGQWDHFDRHVEAAARVLGLKVHINKGQKQTPEPVQVPVPGRPRPLVDMPVALTRRETPMEKSTMPSDSAKLAELFKMLDAYGLALDGWPSYAVQAWEQKLDGVQTTANVFWQKHGIKSGTVLRQTSDILGAGLGETTLPLFKDTITF